MTTATYIVEIFTAEATKIAFVEAESRAAAIKAAKSAINADHVKPAKARSIAAQTANDMMVTGKDYIDLRGPKVATVANRRALGALVGM